MMKHLPGCFFLGGLYWPKDTLKNHKSNRVVHAGGVLSLALPRVAMLMANVGNHKSIGQKERYKSSIPIQPMGLKC